MNVFDVVKVIRQKLPYEWKEVEPEYKPFLINRALSFDMQTILIANELNKRPNIPNNQQFDFLLNTVSKSKKFVPWIKSEKDETVSLLQEFYECSQEKATEYAKILNEQSLSQIRQMMNKGGRCANR